MSEKNAEPQGHCFGCVYFPPNLPRQMYAEEDWDMLQKRSCSFEHHPGDEACRASRKTSCSLVDLRTFSAPIAPPET